MPLQEAHAPKKSMSAPLAASTASRNKLKAFEFTGDVGLESLQKDETEKENAPVRGSQQRDAPQATLPKSPPKHLSSGAKNVAKKNSEAALGYPQTPVGRVPLQELIHNDGNLLEAIPNISPTEQVVWNRSPQSSDQMDTPALRRGKRKRQPSEPSSSQPQASNHFVMEGRRPPNEGNAPGLLRTPQADPVKELWNRYSIDGPERTPITSAAVARFLNSSSPRCNDSERGLQRSLTCGSAWPTSAAKRRRIDKTLTQINFNYSQEFKDILKRKDEAAKCRDKLIQKINQSFALPPAWSRDEAVSSSSPTVSNEDPNHHLQDSPLHRLNTGLGEPSSPLRANSPPLDDGLVQSFSQTEVSALQQESVGIHEENEATKESSSDYGGYEVEYDMLEEATLDAETSILGKHPTRESAQLESLSLDMHLKQGEHQILQISPQADHLSKPHEQDAADNMRSNEVPDFPLRKVGEPAKVLQVPKDEYEFDDDDDFLDAELEAVVASYDVRSPPKTLQRRPPDTSDGALQPRDETPHQSRKVAQAKDHQATEAMVEKITHEISSDDEFGVDSDFEELANVFTQAAEQGGRASSDAVRTVHYGKSR